MREINTFALERHAGKYETWPPRSRLLLDGTALDITLPGYVLLRQYATVGGYLLVTDYDCLYEEMTCFILVDKDAGQILCERCFGRMYDSFLLEDLFWLDKRRFTAVMSGVPFRFTIRPFHIPLLFPRLGVKELSG